MPLTTCASREELSDLSLGKLPPQRLDEVAEHLEACSTCQVAFAALETVNDTLFTALRPSADDTSLDAESALQQGLARIRELGASLESQEPAEEDLGTIRDYRLLAKLGAGGMGTVYKALHMQLEKVVALKLLPADRMHPEAVARFKREMKAVGKLHHAHIVQAFDAGEHDGRHFLVMELVDGADLTAIVRQQGRLKIADACEAARQTALALEYVRQHGMVHRDIKPSNLVVNTAGQVKVLDLGLARLHDPTKEGDELTSASQAMGTADYLAPEQIGDSHSVDIRADLYALGCTLYKLLTGDAPYADKRTAAQKMVAHLSQPFPDIRAARPDVPAGLKAVLDKLVAKEPSQRYATPAEVAMALAPFCAGHDLTVLARVSEHKAFDSPAPTMASATGDPSLDETSTLVARRASEGPAPPQKAAPHREERVSLAGASGWFGNRKLLLALAGGGLALLLGIVVLIQTREGTLVLTVEGPKDGPQPVIKVDGEIAKVTLDKDGKTYRIGVQPGTHELLVTTPDGIEFRVADKFTMSWGGETKLTALLESREGSPMVASDGFVSLFNGKDLTGWKSHPDFRDEWRVVDGLLLGLGAEPTFLFSERRDFNNFHLRAEVRIGEGSSAGITCRAPFGESNNSTRSVLGYNAKINVDSAVDPRKTGSLYVIEKDSFLAGNKLDTSPVKADEWFVLDLTAKDDQILIQVNGKTTTEYRDPSRLYSEGHVALQFFNGEKPVEFRKIEVKELPSTDPDRLAAEYILAIGGRIQYSNGEWRQIEKLSELPHDEFKLVVVHTTFNPKVSDAGLAVFRDCRNLEWLTLNGNQVGDEGLRHFKNCRQLSNLSLGDTLVTDAGLAHFEHCQGLVELDLSAPNVTSAGLARFKDCKDLAILRLRGAKVDDAGLELLTRFGKLTDLDLRHTQAGDATLERHARLPKLRGLNVKDTKVSESGVKKFAAALPACGIEWDGGVIEPTIVADPDRRAAEWVLANGGVIQCRQNGADVQITELAALPRGKFELVSVAMTFNAKVNDAGLAHFRGCRSIYSLDLTGTKASDAGMEAFKDCRQLSILRLPDSALTDATLATFKGCEFWELALDGNRFSDQGLAQLDLKQLAHLGLLGATVDEPMWARFLSCQKLIGIDLRETSLTDAQLQRLVGFPKLAYVKVQRTAVTEAGVKKLAAALPGCKIEWDGGVIEPRIDPDRRAAEWVLSVGGVIDREGGPQIRKRDGLPAEPIKINSIVLQNCAIEDDDLRRLQGLSKLLYVHLAGCQIGDAGIAQLRDNASLEGLELTGSNVTEACVESLAKLPNLRGVDIGRTKFKPEQFHRLKELPKLAHFGFSDPAFGDADAKQLTTLPPLEMLVLNHSSIGDEGLRVVAEMKTLTDVQLERWPAGDAGLAHLAALPKLRSLIISKTKVTDEGLATLSKFPAIERLVAYDTGFTDHGLERLATAKSLKQVAFYENSLTAAGVDALHKALPACKIEWDGGVVEPTDYPDRRAAEYVQSIGGVIRINGQEPQFAANSKLPAEVFTVTEVNLFGIPKVSDAGLASFKGCRSITALKLDATPVSDAGLAHFKGCTALAWLNLSQTQTGDAGLAHLQDCKQLANVFLSGTAVSDATLERLASCPKLATLNVKTTKVTEAGVKKLAAALPGCTIEWDGGVIEPALQERQAAE